MAKYRKHRPIIADISTRIVMPLGRLQSFKNQSMSKLTPEIEYNGEKLLLVVPQLASIPAQTLKHPVGSLSHVHSEIIATIDFAITGG